MCLYVSFLTPIVAARRAILQSRCCQACAPGDIGDGPSKPVLNAAAFGTPLLAPADHTFGVPPREPVPPVVTRACDIYETAFGAASRNICGPVPVPSAR